MPEQTLRRFLLTHKPVPRLLVGFSAGLDSVVLLHALHRLAPELGLQLAAIHVHHGLSPHADDWAAQAQAFCAQRQIPLTVSRVSVGQGASLEAEARQARYQAYREALRADDALVLAHHQDDQAETLLFRLLRGAGVRGLGAMQAVSRLGLAEGRRVPLWRPLLALPKRELEAYALAHGLGWVEDESNQDLRYARNFLRQTILPALRTRWPQATPVLAATAQRMRDADALLAEYAVLLLAPLRQGSGGLAVAGLLGLTEPQRKLVLRHILEERGLPLPAEPVLDRVEQEVLLARADATPVLAWPGAELRRYRDGVYVMAPLHEVSPDWEAVWPGGALDLPCGRRLRAESVRGAGLRHLQTEGLQLRYRRGGEKIRPVGVAHHRELKTLLQEAGVPPWERERLPLVFVQDELVAVVGHWMAEGWQAAPDEDGLVFRLE